MIRKAMSMSLLAAATARLAPKPACGQSVRSSHPLQMSLATGAAGVQLGPRALALAADLRPDGREGKPALEASVQREAVISRIPSLYDLLL
jgi:hypothetical protein